MKSTIFIILILASTFSFSQEGDWVEAKGEITKITRHRGKRMRISAIVKFYLEDGSEQFGSIELLRIPYIGRTKSVGDEITINYNRNNPVIVETVIGRFFSSYGMYLLIIFGIIFSIKPFIKRKGTFFVKNQINKES